MDKWSCKIKKRDGILSEWDQRKLSEHFKNMAMSYNLEYIIIVKKD